jgi:hypothetical protein
MTKESQLKWAKPRKRTKHSPKVKLDRKLVGSKGGSGIWSRLVKLRASERCEVCGSVESLNAHHIEGRRNEATRYDLKNGVCLCSGCHVFRKQSAHQSPLWFVEWLKEHRNTDYYYIMTKRNEVRQWAETELKEILEDYINLEKELNDQSNARKGIG